MTTHHHAKAIMIQGTSSSVGKSVMAAALCRILAQNGVNVAPFKAQNMSNNSYVTADGGEMGRAQVVQAQAAGVEPHTDMNPVLLKPEADSRSQVVINGKAVGSFEARKYWGDQSEAWTAVTEAYDRLAAQYDVIVLEGAGSPAEVNLRDRDIVNMRMAAYANASVILVGDIDRGGVFASLLGTMELLLPEERSLVKATLINRFRGDIKLLNPLPEMIAERTGVPVAGIIPFLHDLQVKDEDGVTFGDYDPPAVFPPRTGGTKGGDSDAEPSHSMTSATNEVSRSSLLREGPREGRSQRRPSRSTTPGAKELGDSEPSNPMTSATNSPPSQSGRELEGGGNATRDQVTSVTPGADASPSLLREGPREGRLQRRPSRPTTPGAITIGVVGLPRVSNHDDLDPFRRAGCRIRIATKPSELASAQIIIIPGSKSTIADLRWMKSRGLDKAIIEAAIRNVTIIGICGGYQILGEQLDDPNATESSKSESESGLGLLPISTIFDTTKTTRRVIVEIPAHKSGPLKGEQATGTGYEIHTGITTGQVDTLATISYATIPSEISPPSQSGRELEGGRLQREPSHPMTTATNAPPSLLREGPREGRLQRRPSRPTTPGAITPDGAVLGSIIGTYVHGIFDSPDILRRLLNTTAQTHDLPNPIIEEFSMEAEYDRLAQTVRENIDMNLINDLIKHPQ